MTHCHTGFSAERYHEFLGGNRDTRVMGAQTNGKGTILIVMQWYVSNGVILIYKPKSAASCARL